MDLTIAGGLGGRGAAEAIRELDPQARLVVASGYSNDPALANPHGFGFDASIEKPFLIQDLGAVLRDVLEAVRPEPASDPRSLRPEPNG
ncbi:MAG: hypothetical protein DHS20C21_17100 [Gemmatimonadota bacterium]|nr:MAG: hypothetical protein DHS20C21_17100 [Gemmatimonadota bacterium]